MILAAADGSALGNPGPAGWGWYIDDEHWAADGWANGTNNQGELKAVLNLLEQTAVDADQPLKILCDSQYVINSITKWMPGWKRKGWRKGDGKPVMNVELMRALDEALVDRDVTFEWVKGHAGHRMNEAADKRARDAATAVQNGKPVSRGPGYLGTGSPASMMPAPAAASATPAAARPARPEPEPDLFSIEPDLATPAADELSFGAEIVDLTKSLFTDAVRSDPLRMRDLLHPDFVAHEPGGRIISRARLLSDIKPLAVRPTVDVIGLNQVGINSCLLRWREIAGRRVTLRSSVWVRSQGAWRLLFTQGTTVESGEKE